MNRCKHYDDAGNPIDGISGCPTRKTGCRYVHPDDPDWIRIRTAFPQKPNESTSRLQVAPRTLLAAIDPGILQNPVDPRKLNKRQTYTALVETMAAVVRLKIVKDHLETRYTRQLKGTQQSPIYFHASRLGRSRLDSIRRVEFKVDLDHTDKALHRASEMLHALRDITAARKRNERLDLYPKSIRGYTLELKEYLEDSNLRDYVTTTKLSTVSKNPSSYNLSSTADERLARLSELERKLDSARKLYDAKIFSAYTTLTDTCTTVDTGGIPEEETPTSEQLELLIQLQEESRKNVALKARLEEQKILLQKNLVEVDRLSASRSLPPLAEHVFPLDSDVHDSVQAILAPRLTDFQMKRLPHTLEESSTKLHARLWEDMQPMLAAIDQYFRETGN